MRRTRISPSELRRSFSEQKQVLETWQTSNGARITAPGGRKHAMEIAKEYRMGRVISTPVRLVRYYSNHGYRTALLFVTKGGKIRTIAIESTGVRVRNHAREILMHMRRAPGTVPKAAASMRKAGESLGITRLAAKLLAGL